MNVQKGKISHNAPLQSGTYPNQQVRANTFNIHAFDGDAQQKYVYGSSAYVGGTSVPVAGVSGAGQVPNRLPLVAPLSGQNSTISAPPAGPNPSVGGMPQGPPPGTYGGHGALDLSKQTPPLHQPAHHQIPPGGIAVNAQQMSMTNTGHGGPMQSRQSQGNSQFFNRNQMRPANHNMVRAPMPGPAINPNHPPNTQAAMQPYTNANPAMNQQQLLYLVAGDGYTPQPMYQYIPPTTYYPPAASIPPAGVTFNTPRAPQQQFYRQAAPYSYPMQSSPAVYYQQQQQQQQPQQSQQPQAAVPTVVAPGAQHSQSRENTGSRKPRSCAIRIVDPNTLRDIMTGEEVQSAVPAVSTPTAEVSAVLCAAEPAEIAASSSQEAAPAAVEPAVVAVAVVEAAAEVVSSDVEKETPVEPTTTAPAEEDSLKPLEVAPVEVTVAPTAASATEATEPTSEAPVQVEEEEVAVEAPAMPAAAAAAAVSASPALEPAIEIEPLPVTQENGELPSVSGPPSSSGSPTLVSTSASPEIGEGRSTQKRKGKKNSRQGSTPKPDVPAPAIVAPVTVEDEIIPQPQREPVVEVDAVVDVVSSAPQVEAVEEAQVAQLVAPPVMAEAEDPPAPAEAVEEVIEKVVVANGVEEQIPAQPDTAVADVEAAPVPTAAAGEVESPAPNKPLTLRYSYKDDQWSPLNPEGKKTYDRLFLLELQHNPASQRKPEGLPNLEVVRDKALTTKRLDFTPTFMKLQPGKQGISKRSSQQGNRGIGGDQGMGGQQQPRREIKLMHSIARVERVEDPNVWKPKHAVKNKDDDPDKIKTEVSQELYKVVRGILNKLTPSKFDKLLEKIKSLAIDTDERLSGVIKLFFEKAVDEPIFSSTYARMCQSLCSNPATPAPPAGPATANAANPEARFRKLLLTTCQKEFEKDSVGLEEAEKRKKELETAEGDKKKELEEELEELVNKNRRRSIGNIRFIGELFKLKILSTKIMHQCILRLLAQQDDEESLECLCRLLSTIGKELEFPNPQQANATRTASISQNREQMNGYLQTLEVIVNKRKTSNRIRFMIQDVIDLRKSQWKPRREDNNPKTIEQIHKEAERERDEQEQLNNTPFQGPMGSMGPPGSRDGRQGDRRDRDDRRDGKRTRGGQSDDGWNTVSGGRANIKMDMKQLRIPRMTQTIDADTQPMMLGPGGRGMGHSWGRGASGGMSQSASAAGGPEARTNRYQLLEDDSGPHGAPEIKAPFAGRASLGGPPTSRGHQELRPVSGATKSAFYPPKEMDRGRITDAARPQHSGALGRSRSQQSSRESSVTRPVREVPKEVLTGKPDITDDEIERKAKTILGEFFLNENMEDSIGYLKESLHPTVSARFINQCLFHVLEHDRNERKKTGCLFKEAVKRRFFSPNDILEGFAELLQSAEDFLVDIPKLWEYVAEIVEPMLAESVIPLTFLGPMSSSLDPSLAANFVAATLGEVVKAQGSPAALERLWIACHAQVSTVLPPGIDPVGFAKQNNLEFLLKLEPADKPASPSYSEFQQSLEKYLRGIQATNTGQNPKTDDVCVWIQQSMRGDMSPAFIRALVTAVIESSIGGSAAESKLNNDTFKGWSEALRKYVENVAERELQSLYAVQALVTKRQHPKGLIQGIFEMLYDSNVVSEDGFEAWVQSDDNSEREGKAVALKSLTSFLTWLKEADPESDQEIEG